MEIVQSCYNCFKEIPKKENYFFCSKCLTQVRCRNCSELLEKDAIGCSNCGTAIKTQSQAVNNIEFEQNGDKKKFVANFTDHIGEGLVNSLSTLFLGSNYKSSPNPFTANKNVHGLQNSSTKKESLIDEAVIIDLGDDELNDALTKIFRFDGDKISLINTRVKQTGKLDHAIRLSLLTLYAYSAVGKNQIQRSVLNEILNHAKVYDGNYRVWMAKCDEVSKIDNGDILELSLPGINAAKNILVEFLDSAVQKGNIEFSGLSNRNKRRKKKKSIDDDEKTSDNPSKSNGSRKSPLQSVEELIKENYFSDRRKAKDIIPYIKDNKAITITASTLATVLGRLIKNGKLKREKNSDGQYEYFK